MTVATSALELAGYPAIELQPAGHVRAGVTYGRNVSEGYQRGAGLEYGLLGHQVAEHPLFKEAIAAATGHTVMAMHRLQNLFLILTTRFDALMSKDIIEFGSYRGGSLFFMGTVMKKLFPRATIYGLDTFEGMPQTDATVDLHSAGDFKDTSLAKVDAQARKLGLDNIVLVQGMVEDTFPAKVPADKTFALAHIDLDIYGPIKYVQDAVWDRMAPGGYVVYDDATASSCIGATQAVEELLIERRVRSEQIYPHFVFRVGLTDTAKLD